MSLIVWGRLLLMADLAREDIILKGTSTENNLWMNSGALLGNVIVWLLGVAWSIWRHDSVPDFVELRGKVKWLEAWMDKQYNKYLQKRNQRHRLEARRALDQLTNEETTQAESLAGYHQAREWFAALRQKDQEVIGLLTDYKSHLISRIESLEPPRIFVGKDITKVDFDITRNLTSEEYSALNIDLKYSTTA
jgi:hypothetical protein